VSARPVDVAGADLGVRFVVLGIWWLCRVVVTDERSTSRADEVDYVGPSQSFDEWYLEARPKVVAAVAFWCGSADMAADATDEAFVRALARWGRGSDLQSPTAWVTTVAFNLVRRRVRRAALERVVLRRLMSGSVLAGPAGEVFSLVNELSAQQRRIVLLRHVAGLSQAEIADALRVKRSTVSSTLTDAHRRLRSLLDDDADAVGGGRDAE